MTMNVFDYLLWRGDLPLKYIPLNEIDGMILARFSYLPFERIMEQKSTEVMTVESVAKSLLALPDIDNIVLRKDDINLISALVESPRFQHLNVFGYVNQFDVPTQTQFSAITIQISEEQVFISFRGTDNTLVGWKEDFNMCFVCPVPAQDLSVKYMNYVAGRTEGRLILGGHSKGGNLAVYAAAFCGTDIQGRIESVYNYDGPGFDDKVLSTNEYKRICPIVSTFVPQSSVVGMLLGHEEVYTVVHSVQTGIMQHDVYSWETKREHFVYLEAVTNSSKFIDSTLKAWLSDLDYSQREKFIETVYNIMSETNAYTLREFSDNWFHSAKAVLKSVKDLDDATRQTVTHALKLLVKCAKSGIFQLVQSRYRNKPSSQEIQK